MKPPPVAACLVVLLAGCTSILGSDDEEERIGILTFSGDETLVVEVPETVTRGEEFTVLVQTYGGGCDKKGRIDVQVEAQMAVITPYDIFYTGNGACPDVLRHFEHEAQLIFHQVGEATVVIRGRVLPGGAILEEVYTVQVE